MDKFLVWLTEILVNPVALIGLLLLLFVAKFLGLFEWARGFVTKKNEAVPGNPEYDKAIADMFKRHIGALNKKLDDHLEEYKAFMAKEATEDIMLANLQSEQKHLREKFNDLKEVFDKLEVNQKENFRLVSEVKTHMMK